MFIPNCRWRHTWAAQFSPDDSKLMVSGVVSDISGEIAIFDTGRDSEAKLSKKVYMENFAPSVKINSTQCFLG